jgi:hypothetical protein
MNEARAYVYHGEWVADCPRSCGNVEFLFNKQNPRRKDSPRTIRKTAFVCSYCSLTAPIEWAQDETAITMTLNVRPIPHTRNWYPKGHPVALRYRLPDGQTIHELVEEAREHGVIPPEKLRASF